MAKRGSGKWRKVSVRIWQDAKFKALSTRGMLVYINVITHPYMTSIGVMSCTFEGLAASLGMTRESYSAAIHESIESGMIDFDYDLLILAITNHWKHNPPENPNVIISMLNIAHDLPHCKLVDEQMLKMIEFMASNPLDYGVSFRATFEKYSNLLAPVVCERLGIPFSNPLPSPFDSLRDTGAGAGAGARDLIPSKDLITKVHYKGDTNGPLEPISGSRIGGLNKIPKSLTPRGGQAFHHMEPWEIITWIVWLESDMQTSATKLKTFKQLAKAWIGRINPIWTDEHGRAEFYDWLADIWNAEHAASAKGDGHMNNPAAVLNKRITEWMANR